MSADCPVCDDANAYVADELTPRERVDFDAHLALCAECRAAVESTRRVISQLRSLPEVKSSRDFAALALGLLPEEPIKFPRRPHWSRIAAIAATLTVFAGGVLYFKKSPPVSEPVMAVADENGASIDKALDWLCKNQSPDGSWNAEKWGGNQRFEVALTALPALALLSAETLTPQGSITVTNATRWLQQQQTDDGSFGPNFQGTAYNQSLASLALLRAFQRQPDPELKRSLDAALTNILARQTGDGGWGYLHSPFADRSITEWHIEVLELATALGWDVARPNLTRGQAWLAAHPTPRNDPEEPSDSPSALLAKIDNASELSDPKIDFYRAYFQTAAL